jgi:protein involved in polysaccharide export with SLBB domain
MVIVHYCRFVVLALAASVLATRAGTAQTGGEGRGQFETRAELEKQAKAAEDAHRDQEAWRLRQRLEKGDFQEGDRIVLIPQGMALKALELPDTLVVRAGRVLQFAKLDELNLAGVLRSELTGKLTAHFGRYVRDPRLLATPLIRLEVSGSVNRPNYYYLSADVLLTDVVIRAGGPSPESDLKKVVVRRGADIIWNEEDVRTALTDGLSLDRLHLRAGDEVFVGKRSQRSYLGLLQTGLATLGVVVAIIRFR